MFGEDFRAVLRNPAHPYDARSFVTAGQRRIALVANGRRHGPITRLITPWDIGELTRPFVLLNYAEVERRSRPLFEPTQMAARKMCLMRAAAGYIGIEETVGLPMIGGAARTFAAKTGVILQCGMCPL